MKKSLSGLTMGIQPDHVGSLALLPGLHEKGLTLSVSASIRALCTSSWR